MEFEHYQLPSGEVVSVDATASKGDAIIDFTMRGGKIVQARKVEVRKPAPSITHERDQANG